MEFLADQLDPGNCFPAMALGLHLSESAAGRELHDRSVAFMCGSFGPKVSDPSFLAQGAEAVASLIDQDEVDVAEEEVFGAVVRWVKEDEGARAGALDQLLPLVRFPMLDSIVPLMAEPLFMGLPLSSQLLGECHASFLASAAAADCGCGRGMAGSDRALIQSGWTQRRVQWLQETAPLSERRAGRVQDGQAGDRQSVRGAGGLALGEQGRGGGDHRWAAGGRAAPARKVLLLQRGRLERSDLGRSGADLFRLQRLAPGLTKKVRSTIATLLHGLRSIVRVRTSLAVCAWPMVRPRRSLTRIARSLGRVRRFDCEDW